jgi:hypothetical protein
LLPGPAEDVLFNRDGDVFQHELSVTRSSCEAGSGAFRLRDVFFSQHLSGGGLTRAGSATTVRVAPSASFFGAAAT